MTIRTRRVLLQFDNWKFSFRSGIIVKYIIKVDVHSTAIVYVYLVIRPWTFKVVFHEDLIWTQICQNYIKETLKLGLTYTLVYKVKFRYIYFLVSNSHITTQLKNPK